MKTTICKLPAGRNEQCVKEKKMKTKARSFVHLVQEKRKKKTISPSRQLRYLRPVNGTNVQDSNLLIGVRNFFSCFMFHVKWTGNFRRSVFREVFGYVIDQVFGGLYERVIQLREVSEITRGHARADGITHDCSYRLTNNAINVRTLVYVSISSFTRFRFDKLNKRYVSRALTLSAIQ